MTKSEEGPSQEDLRRYQKDIKNGKRGLFNFPNLITFFWSITESMKHQWRGRMDCLPILPILSSVAKRRPGEKFLEGLLFERRDPFWYQTIWNLFGKTNGLLFFPLSTCKVNCMDSIVLSSYFKADLGYLFRCKSAGWRLVPSPKELDVKDKPQRNRPRISTFEKVAKSGDRL